MNNYITTRTFGEANVTMIHDGSDLWPPGFPVPEEKWRAAMPEANADGAVRLGSNVGLIEIGDATIIIDPGYDDPDSTWQRENEANFVGMVRTPGMQAGLDGLGIDNDAVTDVIITHAHYDHFIGVLREQHGNLVPRFPNARHLLHRLDWEGNADRGDPTSDASIRLGKIEFEVLLDLIDGDYEVVPGLTMIHAPGESPGHCVVRLKSNDETFYYAGDLFHHPCEVTHLDWVPGSEGSRDVRLMRDSREALIAEAVKNDAVIVNNHGLFPPWGRIVMSDGGYIWQYLTRSQS